MRLLVLGLLLTLTIAGCEKAAPAGLSREALRNGTYPSEFVAGGQVTLQDGTFEGQETLGDSSTSSDVTISMLGEPTYGDITGDHQTDAAIVLVSRRAGSRDSLYYLIAVENDGGRPKADGIMYLGDRIIVHNVDIDKENRIVVAVTEAGPGEDPCCPTQRITRYFGLRGGALVLVDGPTDGAKS